MAVNIEQSVVVPHRSVLPPHVAYNMEGAYPCETLLRVKLHCVTSQKTIISVVTTVRTIVLTLSSCKATLLQATVTDSSNLGPRKPSC
jgi:hypothetical protein